MAETSVDIDNGGDMTIGKYQGYYYLKRWVPDQEVQHSHIGAMDTPVEQTTPSMISTPVNSSFAARSTSLAPTSLTTLAQFVNRRKYTQHDTHISDIRPVGGV